VLLFRRRLRLLRLLRLQVLLQVWRQAGRRQQALQRGLGRRGDACRALPLKHGAAAAAGALVCQVGCVHREFVL
jgi:hypothetical protein